MAECVEIVGTYAMLYVDNASVVATFDSRDEAAAALNRFAHEHPEVRDDIAVLELDERGHGTGEYMFATAVSSRLTEPNALISATRHP